MGSGRRLTGVAPLRRSRETFVPMIAAAMVLTGAVLLATSSTTRVAAAGANTAQLHALQVPHALQAPHSNLSAPLQPAAASTAQIPSVHGSSPPCTDQHGLNNPTSSSSQMLDSYQYSVQHGGTTTTVCSLFGNVHPGDVVTATFTVHDHASVEVTLVVDTFVAGTTKSQVLAQCASFSTVPDSGTDACSTSGSASLTVTVPQCGFQIDLVYGEPLASLMTGAYADAKVWIDGTASGKATGCPAGPTPTPTPTPGTPGGPPGPGSGSGSGSGVQAASTPDTGWAPTSLQGLVGIALVIGGSATLVAGRPRAQVVTRKGRRRATRYPRIVRR